MSLPPDLSMPTLADVADRARVSTATVSRVLNTPRVVRKDTRERVEKAILDLGYSPNFGARILAAKRTNMVGAVVPTLDNAIFARGLEAFQKELGETGATMLVSSSSYRPQKEAEQIRTLAARGADALLLIGYDRDPDVYDYLARRRLPHVVAWAHEASETRTAIGFDNRQSMRALAALAMRYGHRRIGMITAPRDGNDRARNRWLGVLDAMADHGIPAETLAMRETIYDIARGGAAFRDLMADDPRPTVVLCGNDVLAAGAITAAHGMGLRVPDDVSITGFDDIDIAQVLVPQLTTVHVPHREMGRLAARMLIEMRDASVILPAVRLETHIVERGSLGPVGSGAKS